MQAVVGRLLHRLNHLVRSGSGIHQSLRVAVAICVGPPILRGVAAGVNLRVVKDQCFLETNTRMC